MTACNPSLEITIDETFPSQDGSNLAVTRLPLTVKVLSTLETLSNTTMIPAGDNATMSALVSMTKGRRYLPCLTECRSTPFVWDELTTRSNSAFTQHERSSSTCPLNTCSGPSTQRHLFEPTAVLGVPSPDGSHNGELLSTIFEESRSDLAMVLLPVPDPWMRHRIAVASCDPVTRVLPSGDNARQVIGAQCPATL
jgi:hypothetical protein